MKWLPAPRDQIERAYLAELRGERMGAQVRVGAVVIGVINTAFMALDAYAYPAYFAHFLAVRVALNGVLAFIHLRLSRTHPHAGQTLVALATSAMLMTVIYATNAPTSDYYVGLMLFLMGAPVVMPFRPVEAAVFMIPTTVAFVISPLILGGPVEAGASAADSAWMQFTIHCCALGGATLAGIASSYVLDGIRLNDFKQRRSLESARDELRELDRAKSRFSANVHHELRTPLTLILSPLEALLSGEFGAVEAGQREYLESMRDNAQRLLHLINNLLDLSKVESSAFQLHRRPLDLGQVVAGLVASAQPLARTNGVRLEARGFDDLSRVQADLDAIEKIFLNLIGNALKFTPSGGCVNVIAREETDRVHVTVSDDGAGIPEEQLGRVFDRFAQVDSSATRAHEGTGIGLALAKELVELHGGDIWAESEGVGRGSRFCVMLPIESPEHVSDAELPEQPDGGKDLETWKGAMVAGVRSSEDDARDGVSPVDEATATEPVEESVDPDALSARPSLLVVEDNPDMRRFLAAILRAQYSVRTASNGREGLEAAREQRPQLIVTDVMMPEMSGTDLCRELEKDPRTRGTPVLLLTARADREMKVEGLDLGARDYVTKPFHPQELLARVRSIVQIEQLQLKLAQRNAVLERTIRELEQAEVQLVQSERLAAVGELAAGIAHEIYNPINFSVNSLQALRNRLDDVGRLLRAVAEVDVARIEQAAEGLEKLDRLKEELDFGELQPELMELAKIATEGLDRTHRLVRDLQGFAAHGSAETEPVDVRVGLASTIRLVNRTVRDAGAEIETDFADDLPVIESSASVLNQVFLNLIKNAAEALDGCRDGRIVVVARRDVDTDGREWVVVEVSDNGPGIEADVRGRIFDPFVSTKPAGRGSGLGLSVCRRILRELRGRIDLLERDAPGAAFEVRLPFDRSDENFD